MTRRHLDMPCSTSTCCHHCQRLLHRRGGSGEGKESKFMNLK